MALLSRVRRVVRRNAALRGAYYRSVSLLHGARLKAARGKRANKCLDSSKIIWIFCTARSGSTWVRAMLADLLPCEVWEEPKIGQLFGEFYERAQKGQLGSKNFVLGDPTRAVWTEAVRRFALETAFASNPSITPERYLLVKEPDGAVGAPILMEALPESRMILLVRDPRDVVASALDATGEGAWMYERMDADLRRRRSRHEARGLAAYVRARANVYRRQIGNAKRAYEAHDGPKTLVRYEDLRAGTTSVMRRVLTELGLPFGEAALARVVERHSWENVPDSEKGSGKFYRKAKPGGWREDLTPEQIEIVEEITAPLLKEFYPPPGGET
ncbi:sulfotransferase [Rubrobacter xylanophilus]|uniref:Sulfotransferase n=1 Tax=Rubrobacter xylanophilus TaxID=49319 RepID=A0A510HKT7_9ACTN|nr:sulfotransferase [Rubrobacter xylanophilus]BBL80629.1 sulfotransferase [Rubrobacter xylanophilus]